MSYAKDSPVPPLPIEAKRVISKRLVELYHDTSESRNSDLLAYLCKLSKEENAYARFWLSREKFNPEWRKEDPHQGKPMKAHLSLVR